MIFKKIDAILRIIKSAKEQVHLIILDKNLLLNTLRKRLRTHKVFTKDQCFNLNYR